MNVAEITASINDNDGAGVTITPSGTTDLAEGGSTDTYDITLETVPTGTVEITVTADPQTAVMFRIV